MTTTKLTARLDRLEELQEPAGGVIVVPLEPGESEADVRKRAITECMLRPGQVLIIADELDCAL